MFYTVDDFFLSGSYTSIQSHAFVMEINSLFERNSKILWSLYARKRDAARIDWNIRYSLNFKLSIQKKTQKEIPAKQTM